MLNSEQLKICKKWNKAGVKISKELRDIIHGYIMSDGYLTPSGCLQVEQSKKQKQFVKWLYFKFKSLRTNSPIKNVSRKDSRTNKITYSQRFYTRTLLKGFRNMWYKPDENSKGVKKYKKCLPKNIKCFFNSTFVTLWFAGDGTKMIGQQGAKIEVTAFTSDERLILQTLFKQKFDISVNIVKAGRSKKGTEQWNIAINASEYNKFRQLITQMPLIPTLFPNKLYN